MTKLDLKIGQVDSKNDGLLLGGPDKDISKMTNDISVAAAQVLAPVDILVENTIDTIRHPINNILNPKVKNGSYKKLLKFIPATLALAVTQALDKPFATVEKAMEYVVNNNLERASELTKNLTTRALANFITSNGKTGSSTLKGIGTFIEGAGDLATSAVKLPFWLTHKVLKAPRNIKGYGTQVAADWAVKKVNEQRINPDSYINLNLINSASKEAANNPDYKPEEKAA